MWESLVGVVLEAAAITVGIVYILLNRRARHRVRNARLAGALLEELYTTRTRLKKISTNAAAMEKLPQDSGQQDFEPRSHGLLPLHGVYDGLVSSSNIAYFDRNIQKLLHVVYYGIQWFSKDADPVTRISVVRWMNEDKEQADGIVAHMDAVIQVVEKFHDRNQYRGRWFPILKAIALEYPD